MVPPVYIRCYARHFIHGISFNSHKNLMRQIVLLFTFYRKGNRGSAKGRYLFKVMPLVSSRAGIKTQVCLLPNHSGPTSVKDWEKVC